MCYSCEVQKCVCVCVYDDTEECVELGEPSRSMTCWGMEGKGGIASGRSGGGRRGQACYSTEVTV